MEASAVGPTLRMLRLVPRKAKKKGEMVAVCRPMMGGRVATMK